jgi:hypothetical protein
LGRLPRLGIVRDTEHELAFCGKFLPPHNLGCKNEENLSVMSS